MMNDKRSVAVPLTTGRRAGKIVTLPQRRRSNESVSLTGLISIMAVAAVFAFDYFASAHAPIGILVVVALALLSNESPGTIVLYAGVSAVLLLSSLLHLYDLPVSDMVRFEKIISLFAIAVFTIGLLRHKEKELKSLSSATQQSGGMKLHNLNVPPMNNRKSICVMPEFRQVKERKATAAELRIVSNHLALSKDPIDPYTRELVRFIYAKSVKN